MAPVTSDGDQYWGGITATLDWCEDNYVVWWAAELWNTVSNTFIFLPCVVGMMHSLQHGLEQRIFWSYFGLASVGLGSWAFHMTLTWVGQLLDELPMIYASCVFLFCVLPSSWTRGRRTAATVCLLLLYAMAVTVLYVQHKVAAFHEAAYAVQVLLIIFLTHNRAKRTAHGSELRSLFYRGVTSYGLGFLCWNIDNLACDHLKVMRGAAGPLAPLLQMHAWWHVGVGLGSVSVGW